MLGARLKTEACTIVTLSTRPTGVWCSVSNAFGSDVSHEYDACGLWGSLTSGGVTISLQYPAA